MAALPKAVCVFGVTGIGKSRLAHSVARRVKGELISVDSVKVYRGLNIGAHKVAMPSDVPLHMYDVTELPSTYSVQSFVSDASDVMTGVLQRGKPPVLFGGSPMYMEWLLFGCGNAAAVDRGAREELEVRLRGMGWEAAKQFVREDSGVDPDNVQFEANDYYRLARLGVTGKLNQTPAEGYKEPLHKLDYRGAFLFPTDRVALYHSINRRCEMMVAEGFLEEVLQLMHRYGPKALLSIVGYRQAAEFLLAHEDAKPRDFRKFLVTFQTATRNYAKRQTTFFRSSSRFKSVLRCIGCSATEADQSRLMYILLELFNQTPEEYARDDRWRQLPPTLDPADNRIFSPRLEVFGNDSFVEVLLGRVRAMRTKLAETKQ